MKNHAFSTPIVLMHSSHKRAFNDGLIGYLYDISQVWPVFLLAEKLDSETYDMLNKKELFPNLKEIIQIPQFSKTSKRTFFSEFKRVKDLSKIAKNAIKKYDPDIIISESDMSPVFEIYFMRYAKKNNILKVAIYPWLHLWSTKKLSFMVDIENVYKRVNIPLPFAWKVLIVKIRKYLGHFLYYWVYPLMLFELPFIGKSSNLLYKGDSGMRDADYCIVCLEQIKQVMINEGTPSDKIYVFPHPLERSARKIYEAAGWLAYPTQTYKKTFPDNARPKSVLILWPCFDVDTKIGDAEFIKNEIFERRIDNLKLIVNTLTNWRISVKPHPTLGNMSQLKTHLEKISSNIEIVEPNETILKHFDTSDVIIELSGGSAAIYMAFLVNPHKPILSLDLNNEYLGKYYKDFRGIEYIDSKTRLAEILELIKSGAYKKNLPVKKEIKNRFSSTIDLFNYFVLQNNKRKAS